MFRSRSKATEVRVDTTLEDSFFDDVVAAAGLRPLSQSRLPDGSRELRIWIGGGIGWPQDLYRISVRGKKVSAQWIRYWHRDEKGVSRDGEVSFSANLRYGLEGTCDAMRSSGDAEICIAQFTTAPAWGDVLAKLEAEGVWTLPDESETVHDSIIVFDGYGISVEARDGARYRSYSYNNPQAHDVSAAHHAAAIAGSFREVWKLSPPSKQTRIFRGRFAGGRGRYAITTCREATEWGMQGEIGPLMPIRPNGTLDTLSDTLRAAYVEVRGMKAYPGLAKYWGSPFPEIIEVDSVMVVRPWKAEECR
jgi:hypothetical protein